MNKTVWQNMETGETVSGNWCYIWHEDRFIIYLDSIDPITGRARIVQCSGDHPRWGKWEIVSGRGSEKTDEKAVASKNCEEL